MGWKCHCSDRWSYILFVQGAWVHFSVQSWLRAGWYSSARGEQATHVLISKCPAGLARLFLSALRTRILNNWIYYIIYYYEVLNVVCYGMKIIDDGRAYGASIERQSIISRPTRIRVTSNGSLDDGTSKGKNDNLNGWLPDLEVFQRHKPKCAFLERYGVNGYNLKRNETSWMWSCSKS